MACFLWSLGLPLTRFTIVQILEQDEETAGETTIFDYMKGLLP
jgi:hypothetical protein